MNRRAFLATLAAAAAGAVLDPERLLWTPGERTHILPPPAGWRRTQGGIFCNAQSLRKGDIITIEGRYAFNPLTREPTEYLQRFVVVADHTTLHSGGIETTVIIRPHDIHPTIVDANTLAAIERGRQMRAQSLYPPMTPPLKRKDRGWDRRRRA